MVCELKAKRLVYDIRVFNLLEFNYYVIGTWATNSHDISLWPSELQGRIYSNAKHYLCGFRISK